MLFLFSFILIFISFMLCLACLITSAKFSIFCSPWLSCFYLISQDPKCIKQRYQKKVIGGKDELVEDGEKMMPLSNDLSGTRLNFLFVDISLVLCVSKKKTPFPIIMPFLCLIA